MNNNMQQQTLLATANDRIEKLRNGRILLSTFIRKSTEYSGKHWNKLGETSRSTISNACSDCAAAGFSFQFKDHLASMAAPTVTLVNAAHLLESVEKDIHLFDTLSTDPKIDEWNEAIEKLAVLSRAFSDQGMRTAPFDAKRLGLIRGTVGW